RSAEQIAAAVTVGYRGRFALAGAGTRNAVYLAVSYDYLIGLHYLDDTMTVRVGPAGVAIDRVSADHGRGPAVDVGAALVVDRGAIGAAVTGLANRITWTGATARTILYGNLLAGTDGRGGDPVPAADTDVSVPIDARGQVTYRADRWLAAGEVGHSI